MTEYEKDFKYVKERLTAAFMMDQLNAAKRELRHFEDKWMIKLSATDPKFQKDRHELNQLHQEKFTYISKAYLLN